MKITTVRKGDTLVTTIVVHLPRKYAKGQMIRDKATAERSSALWPRILAVLSQESRPLSPPEIAARIGADARSVYASMSSLGVAGGRHYIRAIRGWGRKRKFEITDRGRRIIT